MRCATCQTARGEPSDTPGSKCGRGLAPDGGLRADQDAGLDRVHIRFCGNGCYGFRFYSGSLLKSAKVSKTLLPHHSAPRLGSVCPLSGLNPWVAAMGHPWPSAANPASCRVTHEFKPAFGQRGLTGRLRSRSKARSRATRCASWLACQRWPLQSCVDTYAHREQAPSHIWTEAYQLDTRRLPNGRRATTAVHIIAFHPRTTKLLNHPQVDAFKRPAVPLLPCVCVSECLRRRP
ncbi:Threonine synthase [Pseudomonas orientalis]|nr:Threonine synthase [Pseudomonas orientalis]